MYAHFGCLAQYLFLNICTLPCGTTSGRFMHVYVFNRLMLYNEALHVTLIEVYV